MIVLAKLVFFPNVYSKINFQVKAWCGRCKWDDDKEIYSEDEDMEEEDKEEEEEDGEEDQYKFAYMTK